MSSGNVRSLILAQKIAGLRKAKLDTRFVAFGNPYRLYVGTKNENHDFTGENHVFGSLGSVQKQVPKARRNSNIILWHPSGVRPPVPIRNREPGGRSPFTLNDHRLPSINPPGWRRSEFVFARALT